MKDCFERVTLDLTLVNVCYFYNIIRSLRRGGALLRPNEHVQTFVVFAIFFISSVGADIIRPI